MSKKEALVFAGLGGIAVAVGLIIYAALSSVGSSVGAPFFLKTATHSNATVQAVSTLTVATSTNRQYLKLWNLSNTQVSCALSAQGATTTMGIQLAPSSSAPGNSWEYSVSGLGYAGAIYCVGTATSTVSYIEW